MLFRSVLPRLLETDPRAAADVIVLKPAALGGLVRSLELAQQAHDSGVGAYVTTLMDGPIARAAAAHLAAVAVMLGVATEVEAAMVPQRLPLLRQPPRQLRPP